MNPTRRVLVVEFRDWLHPRSGGAERALHGYFGRLAAWGWRVDYLCGPFPGAPRDEVRDGIRILRRGPGPDALFPLAVLRAVHGELRGEDYDVILEGIDKLPFLLPLLGTGTPVACLIPHLLGETAREAAGPVAGTLVNLGEALLPRCYRRSFFMTYAESTRAELERRGIAPERIQVVPLGLDPLPSPAPEDSDAAAALAPFFLYVGRLRRYKGLETVLRALPEIARAVPAARFAVAGEGDDRERLEQLARELGLADRVAFLGRVSEARKAALMAAARFLVYPSRKEGWGLPVAEAGVYGTPALASDVPGLRDAVRDGKTGLLVPHGDAAALARAAVALFRDDALRERLGGAAKAWAATFDWDVAATRLGAVLDEAVRH